MLLVTYILASLCQIYQILAKTESYWGCNFYFIMLLPYQASVKSKLKTCRQ